MSTTKKISLTFAGMALLGMALWTAVGPTQLMAAEMNHNMHNMSQSMESMDMNSDAALKAADSHHIPALSQSLEKAILAIKAGEDEIALFELQKAQTLLEAVKQAVKKQIAPEYVNSKCPMMGGPIDPSKVTAALTREFNGQTIAFCCNGCPGMWDRLTDEQKQEKVAKVLPAAQDAN